MRIGIVATRLAGTDGVSLETAKMSQILGDMGHEVYHCAGELEPRFPGLQLPELHFSSRRALQHNHAAFGARVPAQQLLVEIDESANAIRAGLKTFLHQFGIEFMIAQNILAIPMQLALAKAVTDLLRETSLPAFGHHHDFYWERKRFQDNSIPDFMQEHFPPLLPNLAHAVINSAAQRALLQKRGVPSRVIPNVLDFDMPPPAIDEYNADFRSSIGLSPSDWLLLQPTRIIPRKGIELAIELASRLDDPRAKLVITHEAGDEGMGYLDSLKKLADERNVDLRAVSHRVGPRRATSRDGRKIYSLYDAYIHADLITYPSRYEGFGNGLLEAIHCNSQLLVNRYPVFKDDLAHLGFDFIEIDGQMTEEAVQRSRAILEGEPGARLDVDRNFSIAREHFSFGTLRRELELMLSS